jgi:hypothetical protein
MHRVPGVSARAGVPVAGVGAGVSVGGCTGCRNNESGGLTMGGALSRAATFEESAGLAAGDGVRRPRAQAIASIAATSAAVRVRVIIASES